MASNNDRCYLSGPFANTRVYAEEEKNLHSFLVSVLPVDLSPDKVPVRTGRAGREVLEKILLPLVGIEPQLSAIHSVAQPRYAVRYSASHPS